MLKVFLIVFLQNVPVFRKWNTPPIVFIPLYHSILYQMEEVKIFIKESLSNGKKPTIQEPKKRYLINPKT